MPTETQDDALHPALAEHAEASENFFEEAAQIFEDRRAPLNPIADKLSAANRSSTPGGSQEKSNDTSQRSPASQTAAPPKPSNAGQPDTAGKIPGLSALSDPEASAAQIASPEQPATALDPEAGIPGPDEYKGGKGFVDNWKKLHAAKDNWKQQANEMRKQLEALKTNPQVNGNGQPDPKVVEQIKLLQGERDNLLARLEAVAVEKSPRFEQAFKPRIEAAISQAKAAVGAERAKRVEEILSLPESAYRDEQIDGLLTEIGSNYRQSKLSQAVAELDRVAAERQALASRGSELYKQWQNEEQQAFQRQRQEREQQAIHTFDSELQGWRQAGYLKDDSEASLARDVFIGKADLTDAARASIWAVVGPKIARSSMEQSKRIKELESELAKFRSVQPGRDTAGGNAPSAGDDLPPETSYADAIARRVQEAGYLRH